MQNSFKTCPLRGRRLSNEARHDWAFMFSVLIANIRECSSQLPIKPHLQENGWLYPFVLSEFGSRHLQSYHIFSIRSFRYPEITNDYFVSIVVVSQHLRLFCKYILNICFNFRFELPLCHISWCFSTPHFHWKFISRSLYRTLFPKKMWLLCLVLMSHVWFGHLWG